MSDLVVIREAADLPQSTTESLFSVAGGPVLVTGLIGRVTADLDTTSNDSYVKYGALVVWNQQLEGVVSGNLFGSTTSANAVSPAGANVAVAGGVDITLQCPASLAGQVEWTLTYRPLRPGAFVEAV